MSPTSVLVAVPTRGHVDYRTVEQLITIRDANPGLAAPRFVAGTMGPADVRNRIARDFLASSYDVLVMVDDDVFPPLRLLELAERPNDWDVIGCPVLIYRSGRFHFAVYDERGDFAERAEGVTEVGAIGTGCIAIHRRVLEELHPAFSLKLGDDGELISTEDITFCLKARAAGFRVGCDWTMVADHRALVGLGQLVTRK